jgi:DNA-binding CsgD family transcriptional regulator
LSVVDNSCDRFSDGEGGGVAGQTTGSNGDLRQGMAPPAFVGREPEMAAVVRALSEPPALVLVEGEAGIGKSRLLREVLSSQARQKPLVAGCLPFPEPFTLGPLVDAIRQATDRVDGLRLSPLAGALRPLFPEWSATLPPALEPAEDATAARHRLFRALAELLDRLGVGVLVLEDAHWADQATLEFLLFLAARQPHPFSLVVTYRAGDVAEDSLVWRLSSRPTAGGTRVRVELEPLDVVETAALVSSMLEGGHVSDEFAAFVHGRTDGVPLAIEESVRLMGDRADLTRRSGEWVRRRCDTIDVPATIRDSVLERVRRLGSDAEAVLRAAAVLAEPIRKATLIEVTGLPSERARVGLANAVASGLLHERAYRLVSFGHVLAARAVYEAIPVSQCRELHGRAGRALKRLEPQPYPQLARHMREVGDTSAWCQYGEEAADQALVSGDESTAAALLYDLLTSADLPAEIVARLAGKFTPLYFTGARPHETLISSLRSILDSSVPVPHIEAEIRFHLGRVLTSKDEHAAACFEFERAIPGLAHDPAAQVRAIMMLAYRGTTLSASERLSWLQRAAAVRVPSMTAGARLRAAIDRIDVMLSLGGEDGWSEAVQIPDVVETAEERLLIARAGLNLGDAAMIWGRYSDAGERLDRALDFATQHGYASVHDRILGTQVHLDWFTGRWHGLAERATALEAALEANDDLVLSARDEVLVVIGLLHAVTGDDARANDCLGRVMQETRKRGAIESLLEPAAALANLRLSRDRVDDALRITEEPTAHVVNRAMWVYATDIVPARVAALIAAGRIDDATALVGTFDRGMRHLHVPAAKAALMQCHAMLAEKRGELARAAALFATVAAMWQELPRPYAAALGRERQAACLIASGATEHGIAVLRQALEGLNSLGASRDVERVALTLRGHGVMVRGTRRSGRRSYGDQLSPRELAVVRLVAAGQTNRDIAESLNRSTATVATQLQSAMRKLGAPSRAAVAVRATEAGLIGNTNDHTAMNESPGWALRN